MPRSPVGPTPSDTELLRGLVAQAGDRYRLDASEILLPAAGGKVFGPFKEPAQVAARLMIATGLRAEGWSWPRIGRALGYADHTSVMRLKAANRRRCPCCHRLIYG